MQGLIPSLIARLPAHSHRLSGGALRIDSYAPLGRSANSGKVKSDVLQLDSCLVISKLMASFQTHSVFVAIFMRAPLLAVLDPQLLKFGSTPVSDGDRTCAIEGPEQHPAPASFINSEDYRMTRDGRERE